jgi:predicted methyltransferase
MAVWQGTARARRRISVLLLAATVAAGLSSCAAPPPGPPQTLEAVVAGPQRAPANKVRDRYRHPLETLEFFGITESMTVMEVSPGSGWYSEILAPYLRDRGHYFAAVRPESKDAPAYVARQNQALRDKFKAQPEFYRNAKIVTLGAPDAWKPLPPGSADMVLTFRNVHNWLDDGTVREMFGAFYRSLRKGGVLGVVEHRAAPGTSLAEMIDSGYVTQDLVVKLAEEAGFRFVAWEEINANPKDTKHYPKGVWTLPPTLALGEIDQAKYLLIGESDRMTLRFVKP